MRNIFSKFKSSTRLLVIVAIMLLADIGLGGPTGAQVGGIFTPSSAQAAAPSLVSGQVVDQKTTGNGQRTTSGQSNALASGFTYQGRLSSGGGPAEGQYDLQFTLYDALTGGTIVSTPIILTNQTVTDGLFTVTLDFGASAFDGNARYLEIAVQSRRTGLIHHP